MYTLYLIRNIVNDKVYVGQTYLTPKERFDNHNWSSRKKDYFHYAIRKHGKKAFEVYTLGGFSTREAVSEAEIYWISFLRCSEKEFGYNTTLGGEYGAIPNDEVKEKIAAGHRGRKHTEETKQLMSEQRTGENNSFFGKSHTPETVEKIRETCRETLAGEKNPWFGKTLSQEHRNKISESKKGKKLPPRSEETRRKLSEVAKARWAREKAA